MDSVRAWLPKMDAKCFPAVVLKVESASQLKLVENRASLTVLKSQKDFLRLKNTGYRFRSVPWLLLNWTPGSPDSSLRCGWTVSRRIGSAVVRNRLKRWCRYYLHSNKKFLELPIDLNIVFLESGLGKNFFKRLKYNEFKESMDAFFRYLNRSGKISRLAPH